MTKTKFFLQKLSLPQRILIGLVIGTILGLLFPKAIWIGILGSLFVGGLKAIAPMLVFLLVISSLSRSQTGFDRRFGFVIFEYLLSTFLAAIAAVVASFMFPVSISLDVAQAAEEAALEESWKFWSINCLVWSPIPFNPLRRPIISPSCSGQFS